MAQPNIFELLRQLSETSSTEEKVGQKRRNREDTTIAAILHLLEKQPDAAKQKDNRGCTPLHQAIRYYAPLEIVDALLKSWPDAAKQKQDEYCFTPQDGAPFQVVASLLTPLHIACMNFMLACMQGVQLEIVTALLQACPDAVKEKDRRGRTPLHHACEGGAPLEVVAALLQAWPDAAKEKDGDDCTPLDHACYNCAPLEVLDALLQAWPDAAKEQDNVGLTLLHYACLNYNTPSEVIKLLLNTWLSYTENRTESAITTLQRDDFNLSRDAEMLFSHLFALYNNNADNPSPNKIIDYFIRIEVWNGATLVLERHPTVFKTMGLDTKVMADFLSTVGRRCRLTTMWGVLCNEQDLLGGV